MPKEKQKNRNLIFWNKSLPKTLVYYLGLTFLFVSLNLTWLYFLQEITNSFDFNSLKNEIPDTLYFLVAAFALSFLIELIFNTRTISWVNAYLKNLGFALWKQFLDLEYKDFQKQKRLYYFDIYAFNYWRFRESLLSIFLDFIPASVIILILSLYLLYLNLSIFLIVMVSLLLINSLQFVFLKLLFRDIKNFNKTWREFCFSIGRWMDQFELNKLFRGVNQAENERKEALRGVIESGSTVYKRKKVLSSSQSYLNHAVKLLTIITVAYFIKKGNVGLNDLVFVVFLLSVMQNYMSKVQSGVIALIKGYQAYKELDVVRSWPQETPRQGVKMKSINSILFENITFGYTQKLVIENFSLYLERNKIYLIKGKNGSGKSTLMKLFAGLMQPNSGSIKVDGKPFNYDDYQKLKLNFSILHQTSQVFYGALNENIEYGLSSSHKNYKSLFMSLMLDKKMDENVGENGEYLSGGEAQKVKLIRELVRPYSLLILDEPLNNLDVDASQFLIDNLRAMTKDKIVLIVSHSDRFSNSVDRTINLEEL